MNLNHARLPIPPPGLGGKCFPAETLLPQSGCSASRECYSRRAAQTTCSFEKTEGIVDAASDSLIPTPKSPEEGINFRESGWQTLETTFVSWSELTCTLDGEFVDRYCGTTVNGFLRNSLRVFRSRWMRLVRCDAAGDLSSYETDLFELVFNSANSRSQSDEVRCEASTVGIRRVAGQCRDSCR